MACSNKSDDRHENREEEERTHNPQHQIPNRCSEPANFTLAVPVPSPQSKDPPHAGDPHILVRLSHLGEIGGVMAEEHGEHLDVLECHGRALSGVGGGCMGGVAYEHDPRGTGLGSQGGAVEGRPVW